MPSHRAVAFRKLIGACFRPLDKSRPDARRSRPVFEEPVPFDAPGGFGLVCTGRSAFPNVRTATLIRTLLKVSTRIIGSPASWLSWIITEPKQQPAPRYGFLRWWNPSLMPPATAASVLDALSAYWTLAPDIEITLEANPSSVEARKFEDFKTAGVNRISIGVQSFDDAALRFLGRGHGAEEAKEAVKIAKRTFDRSSFDLIYALPGQQPEEWVGQLDEALAFDTGHLSLYQLTVEKGTKFYSDRRDGAFELPNDELAADLYELTNEMTTNRGLNGYEVSNYAVSGLESRHNLIYWRGGDYIGIGPGAHGRLTIDGKRYRTEQVPLPENWLSMREERGHATRIFSVISEAELKIECLMMGLRLVAGIDRRLFAAITRLRSA